VIAGAVLLASLGWAFTFGLAWGNFWLKIGVTVACVCAYALAWKPVRIRFAWSSLAWGVVSAAVLYLMFLIGNAVAPLVLRGAHAQVGNIYGLGGGSSQIWIFLLLFFVTGPGEEIFWRGFLQGELEARWGRLTGFVAATVLRQPDSHPRRPGGWFLLGRPLRLEEGPVAPDCLALPLERLHLRGGANPIANRSVRGLRRLQED
jgi:hypothetical protein